MIKFNGFRVFEVLIYKTREYIVIAFVIVTFTNKVFIKKKNNNEM
jgi:hypothetical protein